MPFAPDKTDLKILKLLQENGRITNLQLASSIGLSPAPTLERVRKLENSKVTTLLLMRKNWALESNHSSKSHSTSIHIMLYLSLLQR